MMLFNQIYITATNNINYFQLVHPLKKVALCLFRPWTNVELSSIIFIQFINFPDDCDIVMFTLGMMKIRPGKMLT